MVRLMLDCLAVRQAVRFHLLVVVYTIFNLLLFAIALVLKRSARLRAPRCIACVLIFSIRIIENLKVKTKQNISNGVVAKHHRQAGRPTAKRQVF